MSRFEEGAVPFVPCARAQVRFEARKTGLEDRVVEESERGDRRPDVGVEVGVGPAPVGTEETVAAVERHGDDLDARGCDLRQHLGQAREQLAAEVCLREIVASQPEVVEPLVTLIEGEDHVSARDALHLAASPAPSRSSGGR